MRSKYGARNTVFDGITFDSKREAERYRALVLLQSAFVYTRTADGKTVVEDVKGMKTKEYIIKRKLFRLMYPEYEFCEVR